MRRKLTAALLTAAMAISLTACGGSGDTASAGASTGETASVTEAGGTTTASRKEVLRVAMSADYAPFDWLQEDDSNGAVMTSNGSYMNGYDVLVAKYIAEKLDMDLEITQIDWDGLILSIQSGKVDCAIAGMSTFEFKILYTIIPNDFSIVCFLLYVKKTLGFFCAFSPICFFSHVFIFI